MLNITKDFERIEHIEYSLTFKDKNISGASYGFPCDENGNLIDFEKLHAAAKENYRKCVNGEYDVEPGEVVKYQWSYTKPAEGTCGCGNKVILDGDTVCGRCGRLYNASGQELVSFGSYSWCTENGEIYSEDDY
jgi:hypothetical protein